MGLYKAENHSNISPSSYSDAHLSSKPNERIPSYIVFADLNGNLTGCNKDVEIALGYGKEELIGHKFSEFVYPHAKAKETLNEIARNGVARNFFSKLIRKDGRKIKVDTCASLLTDTTGEPLGIIGIAWDSEALATGSAEAKKLSPMCDPALKPSKADKNHASNAHINKRHIIATDLSLPSDDIIITMGKDGTILNLNKAAEHKLGYPKKAIINKSVFEDELPKSYAPLIAHMRQTFSEKKAISDIFEIADKAGNPASLLAESSIIMDSSGAISCAVLVASDISPEERCGLLPGTSYIEPGESAESVIGTMHHLVRQDYSILYVARQASQKNLPYDKIIFLSDSSAKSAPAGSVRCAGTAELLTLIQKSLAKGRTAILLDRPDYISAKSGFDELLKFVYGLNDMVKGTPHIAVMACPSNIFDERQLSYLNRELAPLPSLSGNSIVLDETKTQILRFILNKNSTNMSVNYTRIVAEFSISRMTSNKWLSELQRLGLIRIIKYGRDKHLFLAEKGKQFLARSANAGGFR